MNNDKLNKLRDELAVAHADKDFDFASAGASHISVQIDFCAGFDAAQAEHLAREKMLVEALEHIATGKIYPCTEARQALAKYKGGA